MPVCFVNAARTLFDTANESWVTSRIVTGGGAVAPAAAGAAGGAEVGGRGGVGEGGVGAPAVAADDRDLPGAPVERGGERELEVGVILLPRVGLDRRPGGPGPREQLGVDGIEVSDDDVDGPAERGGVIEPRIGGDDERTIGEMSRDGGRWPIAAREDDRGVVTHVAPFAGITRSRFEGSATPSARPHRWVRGRGSCRPLSPDGPSSPWDA